MNHTHMIDVHALCLNSHVDQLQHAFTQYHFGPPGLSRCVSRCPPSSAMGRMGVQFEIPRTSLTVLGFKGRDSLPALKIKTKQMNLKTLINMVLVLGKLVIVVLLKKKERSLWMLV
ncbi:uncharacterized protein HKW66_Vig0002460 [Vigna angularis]|uniref:Uncharacterized protein n=1 Tax=Phaseolus angularis TaxID=3914 RepID=A0A8T0LDL0_PHAAN|nr:uncharacterized protein HKW66_Vig0002460 [Vigna angularis]